SLLALVLETDSQHPGGAAVGPYPVDKPAEFALNFLARRQNTDRLVQIERSKRAQLAPYGDTQRIGCARARRRHQQPWCSSSIGLLWHVTSVSRRCWLVSYGCPK